MIIQLLYESIILSCIDIINEWIIESMLGCRNYGTMMSCENHVYLFYMQLYNVVSVYVSFGSLQYSFLLIIFCSNVLKVN